MASESSTNYRLPHTLTAPGISVYQWYDEPPPHPGSQWTRFVCLSDTHAKTINVPPGDALIHSGDLTEWGGLHELRHTMVWLYDLPHPHKFVIAGNHDLGLDRQWCQDNKDSGFRDADNVDDELELMNGEEAINSNITYLEYGRAEVQVKPGGKKWQIYGSPGSPEFGGMAFNYDRGREAKEIYAGVPDDTDILITHGPPHSVLDVVLSGTNVGCEMLQKKISEIKPILHVFGHIHEDRGAQIFTWSPGDAITVSINASNMPYGAKWATERRSSKRPLSDLLPPIIVDLFDPSRNEESQATGESDIQTAGS